MTDKTPEPQDERPDADEVFAATVRNLLNTPHQPHKAKPVTAPESKKAKRKG
jgi:hypothetical protein